MKQGKKLLILPAVAVLLGMGTGCSGNSGNKAQDMARKALMASVDNPESVKIGKHSDKYIFYTLRFDCSFAAANTIKPQLL